MTEYEIAARIQGRLAQMLDLAAEARDLLRALPARPDGAVDWERQAHNATLWDVRAVLERLNTYYIRKMEARHNG